VRRVADLGVPQVERLRFRVGTIRPVRVAGARRTLRSSPALTVGGKPQSSACSNPIPAGTRCRPCADAEEQERTGTCERILFEAPWMAPEEVLNAVPGLTAEAYDRIRRRLLRAWVDEMRLARKRHAVKAPIDHRRIRRLASSYVLLETRIDPNRLELESPVRRNALGDLYPFIREVETGSAAVLW
jgi:hypothetical protein